MPNIVVVGRSSLGICDKISEIVTSLGVSATDGVITYSPELCCINMSAQHRDSPYLIVRDTDRDRGVAIGEALNKGLNIDVEVEVLSAFFLCEGRPFEKQE
jgi:hypothetical protein